MAPAPRAPSEAKVSVVALPCADVTMLAKPAVGVSAPTVSVVTVLRKPRNSSVPPAVRVTESSLKVTAPPLITSESPAVARSLSVPFWIVVAPVYVLAPLSTQTPDPILVRETADPRPLETLTASAAARSAFVGRLRVMVVAVTAVIVVPKAIPVPETYCPTAIPVVSAKRIDVPPASNFKLGVKAVPALPIVPLMRLSCRLEPPRMKVFAPTPVETRFDLITTGLKAT